MKKKSVREELRAHLVTVTTPLGNRIEALLAFLTFVFCMIFVLETYPLRYELSNLLWIIELIIVAIFIVDYALSMYAAKNRTHHFFSIYSLIDLITILPTIILLFFPAAGVGTIKLFRIIRVLRIFRFLRFMRKPQLFFGRISMHTLRIFRLIFTILVIFFVSSGFFWQAEKEINPKIDTFGDAFYFTVVSLATVGYGDIIPHTDEGRAVTVLMILSGIIFIPWEASQIAREWSQRKLKNENVCMNCGHMYHDKDAKFCKICGNKLKKLR